MIVEGWAAERARRGRSLGSIRQTIPSIGRRGSGDSRGNAATRREGRAARPKAGGATAARGQIEARLHPCGRARAPRKGRYKRRWRRFSGGWTSLRAGGAAELGELKNIN